MDALTARYRDQSIKVRAATLRDLQRLWPALRYDDLDGTFPALLAGVSPLIQRDRGQMSALAEVYLRAHRLAHGIGGDVVVKTAPPAPPEQVAIALQTTSVVAVKIGTRSGLAEQAAMANAFVQTAGSVGRLVLNGGRDTITQTTTADPKTRGWQRVGTGRCDFCRMLIGRGAVYTEATASFQSHDHCTCTGEPVYN